MIVVVGSPAWNPVEPASPSGRACAIALAAASRGAGVELVGRAGEDPAGDRLLIALARAGVGHIALLRDPYRPTRIEPVDAAAPSDDADDEPFSEIDADDPLDHEGGTAPVAAAASEAAWPVLEPADVDLGLRYIPSYGVIVVTDDVAPEVVAVAVEASAYAGAALVVLVGEGSPPPGGLPATTTVLEAPAIDHDGAFAAVVAGYAASLADGLAPDAAFAAATAGWESPEG